MSKAKSGYKARSGRIPNSRLSLAAILPAYFVISIGIIVWRGLAELRRREQAENPMLQ